MRAKGFWCEVLPRMNGSDVYGGEEAREVVVMKEAQGIMMSSIFGRDEVRDDAELCRCGACDNARDL
jgi:hypothetical protein